ncbi:hypothetical protein [Streptomyces lincolnensis]|uniref:hypothetical protein n=1 Tax=Streptomyces lincolnensis TaxID=1915 RepID=UPI0008352B1B|nr:hypothetical protein [Streptomyces lincolnensis]QMV04975.1 hypothetical protein GJU35_04430 [Streptomyces lincolnensis]
MNTILLAVLLPLLLLWTVASAGYFLVVLPHRWREPYEQSLALLDSDDRDELERADRLLGDAVNAGPRGRALDRIRFAQAHVRAMLGTYDPSRYGASATVLDELIAAQGRTEHTAYLELWVQARLENHARVTDLYAEHRTLLDPRPDSRRIAAVSHLHLAVGHWRRRETDGALHHFDRVRELGELTDRIPPEVNDLQLVKGVQAVFDGRTDEAREAFGAARKRADEQGLPMVEAEAGILVCDWQDGDPDRLGERLDRLAEQAAALPAEDDRRGDLGTGIAVLRLLVLLREWLARPALSGAPSPVDFQELERRAGALREADPELGDADLVEGLVRYHFALNQPEREKALAVLDRGVALAKGVGLPEVVDLMERERALGGEGDAISRYLALIGEFLDDPGRSEEDRIHFRRLKARFTPFGDPGELPEDAVPHQRAPLEDQRRRSEALRRRIELIVYPRIRDLADDAPAKQALRGLLDELDRATEAAAEGAGVLHEAELRLVTSTAQTLLPEETDDQQSA